MGTVFCNLPVWSHLTIGKNSGPITSMQIITPTSLWLHCFVHNLFASKEIAENPHLQLHEAVKAMHLIKGAPMNLGFCTLLCDDMGFPYH